LGVESLYVATPPALVAVDLHPIVRLGLSRKLHLARGCDCGSRRTINLSESACASQDALRPAVLEERTNIDCGHHGPFSSFRFFYAETLKKAREGGREVVELDIGEEHPVQKYKKVRRAGIGCRASCLRSLRPQW
jgi:predicted  nucleic acid-binding Zn-ribbon protein